MTSANLMKVFVPYDAVFNENPATFEHFNQVVKALSRTDTLFWCSRINLILADLKVDEKSKQQYYVDCFFRSQQIQTLNKFVEKYGGTDHVGVIHRGALLELVRWVCLLCSDLPNDGETFDKPEVRDAFARVLLMASEFWGKRVYGDSAFEGANLDEKRKNSLARLRYSMMETRYHDRPFEALTRGYEFFGKIMPNLFADLTADFHKNTGMSIDEYYLCLCAIMCQYMNSDSKSGVGKRDDTGIFTLKGFRDTALHMEESFHKLFELLSTTPENLASSFWYGKREELNESTTEYSLKPLREHPILKAADGRMIILDPAFFVEQTSVGPLFHILSQNNQNALFAAFGRAFEFYVGNILNRVYPDHGSHLARRLYANVREAKDKGVQVTDFIIDCAEDIIVVEAKAVWIRDDKVSQVDPSMFVAHLRARYGGENGNNKGYKQLARSVRKIADQQWQPAGIDLTRTKRVYPVLLVHDELLDAPIFAHFLAEEFRQHVKPDSIASNNLMVKGCFHVAPLIVMTIDDLECLESSLNSFTLVDLLFAYSTYTPDRLVSLHNFLANNSEQFPLIRSKSLAASCEEILNKCMQQIFQAK